MEIKQLQALLHEAYILLDNHNHLKRKILFQKIQTALNHKKIHSALKLKQFGFPSAWDFDRKLNEACKLRIQNPPTPVITGHPTECMAEDVRIAINLLLNDVVSNKSLDLNNFVKNASNILEQSWLPHKPLTPIEEIRRQNSLYLAMVEQWHDYNKQDITLYLQQHPTNSDAERQAVITQLTLANQHIFKQITSWFVGDVDGNTQKSLASMQLAPKLLQLDIINKYFSYIETLMQLMPEMRITLTYLNEIKKNIEYHKPLSQQAAAKLTDTLLDQSYHLNARYPKFQDLIHKWQDFLFITHFTGDLRHHFRESATALDKAIANPDTPEAKRILEMLEYVKNHSSNFTVVLSDTQNSQQIITLNKLLNNTLEIIPLCETAKDLENLPKIIFDIIQDPKMRNKIIKRGRISYLAGPSDLGAREGELKLIDLLDTENAINELLQSLSKSYPDLAKVQLKVFYGLGNDPERRLSKAQNQLWSTHQGFDASALAEPRAFTTFLKNMTGLSSENTLRTQELKEFAAKYPNEYSELKNTIQKNTTIYHNYIHNHNKIALMQQIIYPELNQYLNNTSRAESKQKTNKNIASNRAIGQVNQYQLSRWLVRRFIGMHALPNGPIINLWYNELTAFKELLLKSLSAIACTNFARNWQRIGLDLPSDNLIQQWALDFKNHPFAEKPHYALAYGQLTANDILNNINTSFQNSNVTLDPKALPNTNAVIFLDSHPNLDFKSIGQDIKSNLLPHYKLLEELLDVYMKDKTNLQHIENIVSALRMDNTISTNPAIISNLRSSKFYFDANHIDLANHELQRIEHYSVKYL